MVDKTVPPLFQQRPEIYRQVEAILLTLEQGDGAEVEITTNEPFYLVWAALVQLAQKKKCIMKIDWENRDAIMFWLEER